MFNFIKTFVSTIAKTLHYSVDFGSFNTLADRYIRLDGDYLELCEEHEDLQTTNDTLRLMHRNDTDVKEIYLEYIKEQREALEAAEAELEAAYDRIDSLLGVIDLMGEVIDELAVEASTKTTALFNIQEYIEEALDGEYEVIDECEGNICPALLTEEEEPEVENIYYHPSSFDDIAPYYDCSSCRSGLYDEVLGFEL